MIAPVHAVIIAFAEWSQGRSDPYFASDVGAAKQQLRVTTLSKPWLS
jgi:hypothetical protein